METANGTITSIVLADDDEDDALVFSETVREIDPSIHLEYVADGIKLMQLLHHYYPDIVFIDLDMPRKNGLECLVEIRNHVKLAHLPVVVFSSTTRPANIQTAYDMGAHLYLIKTAQVKDYTSAIQTVLQLNWKEPEAIKKQYCLNGRYAAFS